MAAGDAVDIIDAAGACRSTRCDYAMHPMSRASLYSGGEWKESRGRKGKTYLDRISANWERRGRLKTAWPRGGDYDELRIDTAEYRSPPFRKSLPNRSVCCGEYASNGACVL